MTDTRDKQIELLAKRVLKESHGCPNISPKNCEEHADCTACWIAWAKREAEKE